MMYYYVIYTFYKNLTTKYKNTTLHTAIYSFSFFWENEKYFSLMFSTFNIEFHFFSICAKQKKSKTKCM